MLILSLHKKRLDICGGRIRPHKATSEEKDLLKMANDVNDLISKLTPRELEVVQRVCGRKMYREIAMELNIAESTVQSHVSHIYDKLDIEQFPIEERRLVLFRTVCSELENRAHHG